MGYPSEIIIVAAIAKNRAIGKGNDLLWSLPDDLRHFVKLTKGHNVLMGRKTFDSLYVKPLPNRNNIVVTRNLNFKYDHNSVFIFNNILEAVQYKAFNDKKLFVIGGSEIYKQTLDFATVLELTEVNASFDADAFFPKIDFSNWNLVKSEFHQKDERHKYEFEFRTYKRINR